MDLEQAVERYRMAAGEFAKENTEPVKEVFSHRDDVTLANPFPRARPAPPCVRESTACRRASHAQGRRQRS
jgi:hypothetical protein